MKTKLLLALLCLSCTIKAQSVPVSIANWLNDAKGAYSIIHDDYGNVGVDGIWQYADTIAFNRGIKFTFGAISSDCEVSRNVNGETSPYAYAKNVMMAQHNHEIINHTHTHTCAVNRGWSPCSGTGWGEIKNTTNWNTELKTSHSSIINGTGFQPRYFIFPYDQFTDEANEELALMGYIGSRSGWSVSGIHNNFYKYGYEANDENLFKPDAGGFFRTSVQVFDDVDQAKSEANQLSELNAVVDDAISNTEWGNRELHNVGYSGWGHVLVNAYRSHLDYVKTKVEIGDLWVPTMSEMLTYQIQKLVYTPNANYNSGTNAITVTYTEDYSEISTDISTYLAPLTIKSPITIVIDVTAYVGLIDFTTALVKQGSTTITDVTFKNNKLYVNTFPNEGGLLIHELGATKSINLTSNDFDIYPNPAQNFVKVSGKVTNLSIYSITGLKLFETNNSNNVDITTLTPGVYLMKINNLPVFKRFVKQ